METIGKIKVTATCESCLEGFEAPKACDGRQDTAWKADPYFKWLMLDAQGTFFVDHLRLNLCPEGKFYHYHVECSLDRINWHFVMEKSDDAPVREEGDLIEIKQVARFVKITVSYCAASNVVGVTNVAAYGRPAPAPAVCHDLAVQRVKAVAGSSEAGFVKIDDYPIDRTYADSVMEATQPGAALKFAAVDFGENQCDQLRFCLGLPVSDKAYFVTLEFRLDGIGGEKVGAIHLCRQYTYFTELAIDILHEDGSLVAGKHDLYVVVAQVDAPQSVVLYWLALARRPRLSAQAADYHEKLIVDDQPYQIFFGNMHSHTGFTDGQGTPEQAYDFARNVAKLDFLGITEHSNCLDEMFDCDKSFKWRDLKRAAEKATEDGKFVGLYGTETTWYNQFGHMNLYCADFYLNAYEFKFDDPKVYYEALKRFPGVISQWNHPWSCGNRHLDLFEPYDPALDAITYTIELNNVELSDADVIKYYVIALDKGWHLAPMGNQDNHRADWGLQNNIRTGAIMRRLTAADVYDAMKHLRTYFTGTPGFRVMYSLNGHIQGSIIEDSDALVANVKASCDDHCKITKVEVYGEGGKVIGHIDCDSNAIDVDYNIEKKQKYYFLKLYREDKQIAVTAPVWVKN